MTPASIRDQPDPAEASPPAVLPPLPDFRNLGVLLRVLLGVNLLGLAGALLLAADVAEWPQRFVDLAFRLEPALMFATGFLALSRNLLLHLPRAVAYAVVIVGCGVVAVLFEGVWRALWLSDTERMGAVLRYGLLGALTAAAMLLYFALRDRAVRPAVDAAQVAALTARIRPHFLFNSLNAVLSLIRKEPKRAEEALENLAELFRVLMRDPRDLVPLSEEIALCRQYLELERLRLGDRLVVRWEIGEVPSDLKVPPLMLQPLIENAVYHGIEPADAGGELLIAFERIDGQVAIRIENPLPPRARAQAHAHGSGNRMALDNIRQRLALYYDLEAGLDVRQDAAPEGGAGGGRYRVTIRLPLQRQAPQSPVPPSTARGQAS